MSFLRPLFLVLLPFLIYFPALHYEFVWDDRSFLVENKSIREDGSWATHFADKNAQAESPEAQIYRPVRNLSYRLEYRLFGMDPFWFHFNNLFLHGLNACLLYLLARFCFQISSLNAFLLALFFTLHPLQTEVVCWVKSRDDLLAVFFGVLAFGTFHLYLKTPKLRLLLPFTLLYLLALFSKESSLFLCAVFFLWALHQKPDLDAVRKTTLLTLLSLPPLLYLIFRFGTLGQVGQDPFYLAGNFFKTQLGMALVYRDYLLKILMPWNQRVNYMGFDPFLLHSGSALLAVWGLLLLLGLWIWFRSPPEARIRLIFFILSFVPVSNLIPMMQWEAERFLYFPLFFFALLAERLIPEFKSTALKKGLLAFVLVYLAFLGFQTVKRERIWENDRTLGLSMLASNPASYHGLVLALDYNRKHEWHEETVTLAGEYLKRFPDEPFLYDYLAYAYLRLNRVELAEHTIQEGLIRFPNAPLLMKFKAFLDSENSKNSAGSAA